MVTFTLLSMTISKLSGFNKLSTPTNQFGKRRINWNCSQFNVLLTFKGVLGTPTTIFRAEFGPLIDPLDLHLQKPRFLLDFHTEYPKKDLLQEVSIFATCRAFFAVGGHILLSYQKNAITRNWLLKHQSNFFFQFVLMGYQF